MRPWRALFVLWLTAPLVAEQGDAVFSPTMPGEVIDVSSWETVRGSFDTPQLRGSYLFYVNPARQGLYQVMRYRTSGGDGGDRRLGPERLAFVRRPGVREPMLCWEKRTGSPGWSAFAPDTPEYRAEMTMLIRVLALHRPVGSGEAP